MKRKLRILYLNFIVFIKKIFTKKDYKIAILVLKKWKNKVSDDLLLELELLNNKIYTDIIAYDENNDYSKYNLVIIRSIWGYEKNINLFESTIKKLINSNIKILNDPSIMFNNYNKEIQTSLLEKYHVPHIDTTIIPKNTKNIEKLIMSINNGNNLVIKPSISASGNNTYLVSNDSNRSNSISLNEVNNLFTEINKNTSLLVQPFIKEIDNGEISLIYIKGTFSHAILRYPNIFNHQHSIEFIPADKLDTNIFKLANKVLEIKEYQDYLYERIDIVNINQEYYVMELELVEPDLFIRHIPNKDIQKQVLKLLSKSIKEKI